MKRLIKKIRTYSWLLFALLLFGCGAGDKEPVIGNAVEQVSPAEPSPTSAENVRPTTEDAATETMALETEGTVRGTFLGVRNYGTITAEELKKDGAKEYRFSIDGEEVCYALQKTAGYALQNQLMEEQEYLLTVEDEVVTRVQRVSKPEPVQPVLSGKGQSGTVKALLSNAFAPMGTTLYVYGGGWNWQDDGFNEMLKDYDSLAIWNRFYEQHGENYTFRNKEHPEKSTYPYGGWNEYYYAGLDCSGYATWVCYQSLAAGTKRDEIGAKSTEFAKHLETLGFGTWAQEKAVASKLVPGDIISMKGHVWLCLGTCSDGSVLILHSVNAPNKHGEQAGGVCMSALSPKGADDTKCEAYKLAKAYGEKYYPKWYEYNPVMVRDLSAYMKFSESDSLGVFHWSDGANGLTDPEGYRNMSAEEILGDLFKGK